MNPSALPRAMLVVQMAIAAWVTDIILISPSSELSCFVTLVYFIGKSFPATTTLPEVDFSSEHE